MSAKHRGMTQDKTTQSKLKQRQAARSKIKDMKMMKRLGL